ncbi:hypothetical protein ABPG74_018176 [Tetrahymena malaccensis]
MILRYYTLFRANQVLIKKKIIAFINCSKPNQISHYFFVDQFFGQAQIFYILVKNREDLNYFTHLKWILKDSSPLTNKYGQFILNCWIQFYIKIFITIFMFLHDK